MKPLSHRPALLSIGLISIGLAGALWSSAAPAAPVTTSPYYGRWTVSEPDQAFTARGRLYKTIDISACGNDFCGVSVSENGRCGPVLFRFLSSHADGRTTLHGHGKWGSGRKNVQIDTWEDESLPGGRMIDLYLGEGYSFGERSGSMPQFHADYRRTGTARCHSR